MDNAFSCWVTLFHAGQHVFAFLALDNALNNGTSYKGTLKWELSAILTIPFWQ